MYRTKNCGELNINNMQETVELAGWVQKIRNLGGMDIHRFKRRIWLYKL